MRGFLLGFAFGISLMAGLAFATGDVMVRPVHGPPTIHEPTIEFQREMKAKADDKSLPIKVRQSYQCLYKQAGAIHENAARHEALVELRDSGKLRDVEYLAISIEIAALGIESQMIEDRCK